MKYLIALLLLCPLFATAQDYTPVVKSINAFGLDAYYVTSHESDFLLSPLSISSAIAMTYVGALGTTKEEIKKAFHYPSKDLEVNKGFLDLKNIMRQPYPQTIVSVANKLWVGRVKLTPEFVDTNKKYYSAALEPLNFGDVSVASKTINDWVANQTNNKIKELVDKSFVTNDLILVLTNAVYFKSNWQHPFDAKSTTTGKFETEGNGKIDVSFMNSKDGRYLFYRDEFSSMIELPFTNNEFSFLIILPSHNIKELEDYLTPEYLDASLSQMNIGSFSRVRIPKFKSSYKLELSPTLKDLGMVKAFTPSAEFEGIGTAEGVIMISKVIHETFIEVNEEGAEAAGATAVGAVARSASIPMEFIADHAFIYAIRHVKTNTILFIGKVSNPKY